MNSQQVQDMNEAQKEYLNFLNYYRRNILRRVLPHLRDFGFSTIVQDVKSINRSIQFYRLERANQRRIRTSQDYQNPFECSERVFIEDKDGLEKILERTSKKEKLEWGTHFRTRLENKSVIISDICDSEEAEKNGSIIERTDISISWNYDILDSLGANGRHHYHPTDEGNVGSEHFIINGLDKNGAINRINLLSFNVNGKPEIIAYNSHRVYVPVNSSKTRLIKATPRDIFKYLADK